MRKIREIATSIRTKFNAQKKGVITIEYVLILAFMAGIIFVGWTILHDTIIVKINELADAIMSVKSY